MVCPHLFYMSQNGKETLNADIKQKYQFLTSNLNGNDSLVPHFNYHNYIIYDAIHVALK